METDPSTIRLRTERVVWQQTGDEVVVLDLRSSTYFGINASGRTLWPLLEQGASAPALATALAEAHGLSADVARADTDAFLASLRDLDLLDEE